MKVEIDSFGIFFCPVDHRDSFWCGLMLEKPVSCGLGDERLLPWNSYDLIDDKGIWHREHGVFMHIPEAIITMNWMHCGVWCSQVFQLQPLKFFSWPPKKQPQPESKQSFRFRFLEESVYSHEPLGPIPSRVNFRFLCSNTRTCSKIRVDPTTKKERDVTEFILSDYFLLTVGKVSSLNWNKQTNKQTKQTNK